MGLIIWTFIKIVIRDTNVSFAIFFCFFIIVGAFFILNLFDGIVIDNFNNERYKHLGLEEFTSNQRTWI